MEDLRYPIGNMNHSLFWKNNYSNGQLISKCCRNNWNMRCWTGWNTAEHAIPWRGWMVKQVVHHVADSHMNAYIRFRLGMTGACASSHQAIRWSGLGRDEGLPCAAVNVSLTLLHALHLRWRHYWRISVRQISRKKTVYHPEHNKTGHYGSCWECMHRHGKHHGAY